MRDQTFDYIIVGAGSAGGVLASRLSEDPSCRVLLLEAGKEYRNPFIYMPMAIAFFFANPAINWNFTSEPEPGLNGAKLQLSRGKLLGGCSMMNGMTYARGHHADYDDWGRAAPGWSYAEVLPYFRKLESSWMGAGDYHGGDGPVGVSQPMPDNFLYDELRTAFREVGLPVTADYHGRDAEGLGPSEITADAQGRRSSTSRVYLGPARSRPNLTIACDAQVARVVITDGRATGVELVRSDGNIIVHAAREVIVSGGAFNSPQLLMLSGIGPAGELAAMGIKPLVDAPEVGANLTEHPMALVGFDTGPGTFVDNLRIDRATGAVLRWFLKQRSNFASNGCNGHAYLRSDPGEDRPDIQLTSLSLSLGARLWHPFAAPPPSSIGCYVTNLRPDSRGTVKLRSAHPLEAPAIRFNMLTADTDMDRMVKGIRMIRDIFGQPVFADRGTRETIPGVEMQSDADIAAYVRANPVLGQHPVSTCRMGSDARSVVDPELRVRGVEGLRVVDASIMPTIPGGNTNVPTIMLAEKAADLIRGRTALSRAELAA